MPTQHVRLGHAAGISRREVLKAGLAAGATLSAWPLYGPQALWGAEAGPPKRGGILRVRGYDPIHFDNHLSPNFKTIRTLSLVYSKPSICGRESTGTINRQSTAASWWPRMSHSPLTAS